MSCSAREVRYNEWKFVIGIWHSLISPQLGQTTFSAFFALELLLAELAVGLGPSTGLPGRGFGIGDDGFCKGLEIGMGSSRIFVFSPDFDKLGVKFIAKRRERMLPQIPVDSCKQFGFCLQSSSSFRSEDQKTWHRNGLFGLRQQTLAFRRRLKPSDE
jgi:hypothetical protein